MITDLSLGERHGRYFALTDVALGRAYSEKALRDALCDLPLGLFQIGVIGRYLRGTQMEGSKADHADLQAIATLYLPRKGLLRITE